MSRSHKKKPFCTDGSVKTTKHKKKIANRKVRNTSNIPNGGSYKKVSESWNIHDYITRRTWEQFKNDWETGELSSYYNNKTIDQIRQYWERYYKRK